MTSNNTRIVCGTVVLLACIAALVYLSNTQTPDLAALGIVSTIVLGVMTSVFTLARIDRQGQLLKRVSGRIDQVARQTNGDLHATVERIVQERLTAAGSPPLHGQSLDERDEAAAGSG